MNTMKWLVRREYWEHKGMFFWAPLIAAGLIVLAAAAASIKASATVGERLEINGRDVAVTVEGVPPAAQETLADILSSTYMAASAPLMLLMTFTLFFYCLSALFDDRRDRSILFWKSLPVSDSETVISKVATAMVLVPLLYVGIAVVMSIVTLMIGSLALMAHGINIAPKLLANSALYKAPLMVVGLLPVYVLWALPTVGWLLLVSSWAKSKVFLWAVGVPLMALAILQMLTFAFSLPLDVDWFGQNVIGRGLGGLVPGIWVGFEDLDPHVVVDNADKVPDFTALFTQSWGTLLSPNVWIGAAAGVAMLVLAVRMRRWRDEG